MDIQERRIDGIVVLDLQGDLVLPTGSASLSAKVQELVDAGERNLLINAQNIRHVDSVGIEELVRCHTKLNDCEGQLTLTNVTRRLNRLLTITNLSGILDIYDDEEAALSSFHSQ